MSPHSKGPVQGTCSAAQKPAQPRVPPRRDADPKSRIRMASVITSSTHELEIPLQRGSAAPRVLERIEVPNQCLQRPVVGCDLLHIRLRQRAPGLQLESGEPMLLDSTLHPTIGLALPASIKRMRGLVCE